MGWVQQKLEITATKSNHNSPQDDIDEALWEDMVRAIAKIVGEEKYKGISPIMW